MLGAHDPIDQRTRNGGEVQPGGIPQMIEAQAAKALAVACLGQAVADGKAEWHALGNGDLRLRLTSGEVFLLTEVGLTRIS